MKIESISRLLNSFGSASSATQNQKTKDVSGGDEAVRIASGFGKTSSSEDSSSAERSKRVADIKQQVETGSYKPSLNDVATSVVRELFA